MNQSPSPYQPPTPVEVADSWWGRLLRPFAIGRRVSSFVESAGFGKGDAIIFEGISFFVDPRDRETLFAASPSIDHSDERMELITAEVIRVLPLFLGVFPSLRRRLRGRRVMVRMIQSYSRKQVEFIRETSLQAVIDGDSGN